MGKVLLGIDRVEAMVKLLQGKRVGLITNPTGINSQYKSTIDILKEYTKLTALYSPEHGVRGDIQAGVKVDSYTDTKTGLPVHSLYGKNKKPSRELLEGIDVMVIDIQDVGSRLYTYIYTMAYCMMGCKEAGKEFVVLDRPNPVNGVNVEGGLVKEGFSSFVGLYPMPYRYGLTIGELAMLFNKEFGIGCELSVVSLEGWTRSMYYEETGLPWVMPSPNMPSVDTAVVYSGTCIFEGTNISEGRGTTKPFELVGAPWLDARELAEQMNSLKLPGVIFRPTYFTPTFSKHSGVLCGGVQLHVQQRESFKPVLTGVSLLQSIIEQSKGKLEFLPPYSEKGKPMIDYNTGSDYIRTGEKSPMECYALWEKEAEAFASLKTRYHLY